MIKYGRLRTSTPVRSREPVDRSWRRVTFAEQASELREYEYRRDPMRQLLFAIAAAAAVCAVTAGSVAAQPPIRPIGPNQAFNGLVNGSSSNAVIRMACFGPTRPGQTGHPLAGQTLEVVQSASTTGGFTGQAHQIEADIFLQTPTSVVPGTKLAVFDYYNLPAAISTSLELPCWGSGGVVFNPLAGGPMGRPAVVRVSFVGQP
jgi:hypothetical protein